MFLTLYSVLTDFVIFANIFKDMLSIDGCFLYQKHLQIVTGFLNGCSKFQISFSSLNNILRFPTKLLVKVSFGDFRIF